MDITSRHRQESDLETERLLSAKLQAEKMLEARERMHRQNIKSLEDQVRLYSSFFNKIMIYKYNFFQTIFQKFF